MARSIGVNTAIYSPSGGNVGIAFAVPAKTAKEVIEQLKSTGSRQPRLARREDPERRRRQGGEPRPRRDARCARQRGHGERSGGRSGLKARRCHPLGQRRQDPRQPRACAQDRRIRARHDGQTSRCALRQEQTHHRSSSARSPAAKELAKLEPDQPAKPDVDRAQPARHVAGRRLGAAGQRPRTGVAITEVEDGSDAATKGLKSGDVILEVQGEQVSQPSRRRGGRQEGHRSLAARPSCCASSRATTVRFVAVQLKPG